MSRLPTMPASCQEKSLARLQHLHSQYQQEAEEEACRHTSMLPVSWDEGVDSSISVACFVTVFTPELGQVVVGKNANHPAFVQDVKKSGVRI
ncbi:hypothetical protein ANCCAN_20605 [Ancylostoma caninum]|uniref:Uncharacterized protein n=1 Tax=Ancylostoma caninum TaxID=29170 RepID=A0A368FPW0_ANCCA|nr:hypothetical protein ANCCAN_20605 [Ancylostoma caninum]